MKTSESVEEISSSSDGEDPIREIIRSNDIPFLDRYIKTHPKRFFTATRYIEDNPLYIASRDYSIDSLSFLLDLSERFPIQPLSYWGTSPLEHACRYAQLDTTKFLLDRDPPLAIRYGGDNHGGKALLSAGNSLAFYGPYDRNATPDEQKLWARDQVARSEALINMLLDKGASIRDAVAKQRYFDVRKDEKHLAFVGTMLGSSVTRGSYELVSRLISGGADIHERQWGWSCYGRGEAEGTALHVACKYWNIDGIKALLDNCDNEIDITEMVSVLDTLGRLPLHWAAEGPEWGDEDLFTEEDMASRIEDIFEMLIKHNPDSINARDNDGATPLISAVKGHAGCGRTKHFERAIQLLCGRGADAGIQDENGHSALHVLALFSAEFEPINPIILDTLVVHGANVSDTNLEGDTPLHLMAKNLRQANLVRVLIRHGANVNALNIQKETPLHQAAKAILLPQEKRYGYIDPITKEKMVEAHDEMLIILQEAGCSMDQPNAAGKTPRQLLEETRNSWRNMRIRDIRGRRQARYRG